MSGAFPSFPWPRLSSEGNIRGSRTQGTHPRPKTQTRATVKQPRSLQGEKAGVSQEKTRPGRPRTARGRRGRCRRRLHPALESARERRGGEAGGGGPALSRARAAIPTSACPSRRPRGPTARRPAKAPPRRAAGRAWARTPAAPGSRPRSRGSARQAPPPAHEEVAAAARGAQSRLGASTAQSPRPRRPEVRGLGPPRGGGTRAAGARGAGGAVGAVWKRCGPGGGRCGRWRRPRGARDPAPPRSVCCPAARPVPAPTPSLGWPRYFGPAGPTPSHFPSIPRAFRVAAAGK